MRNYWYFRTRSSWIGTETVKALLNNEIEAVPYYSTIFKINTAFCIGLGLWGSFLLYVYWCSFRSDNWVDLNLSLLKQFNIGFHYCRNGGSSLPGRWCSKYDCCSHSLAYASYDGTCIARICCYVISNVSILFGYSFLINSLIVG